MVEERDCRCQQIAGGHSRNERLGQASVFSALIVAAKFSVQSPSETHLRYARSRKGDQLVGPADGKQGRQTVSKHHTTNNKGTEIDNSKCIVKGYGACARERARAGE